MGEKSFTPHKMKLTKEQRLAMQQEKQMQAKRTFMRDKLQREIAYTQKSVERGKKNWEDMCKKIAIKKLYDDIEVWRQFTQRIIDRKDYKIEILMKLLDVSEDQHQRNFSNHLRVITYLTNFCKHMSESLSVNYENVAHEIITDFYRECNDLENYQKNVRDYYDNMAHARNIVTKEYFKNEAATEIAKQENIVNTNIQRCYELRDAAVKKMKQLCWKLEQIFLALDEETRLNARPKDEFSNLLDRQKNFEIEFVKQNEQSDNGIITIKYLQKRLKNLELDMTTQIMHMQMERNYFIEFYWNLKAKVKKQNENSERDLEDLASECYEIIEAFKKFKRRGELLLNLSTCCRKLQTEREKVLFWPDSDPLLVQTKPKYAEETEGSKVLNDAEIIEQMLLLRYFSFRNSEVESHTLLLKEELKELQEENKKYIDIVRNVERDDERVRINRIMRTTEHLSVLAEKQIPDK